MPIYVKRCGACGWTQEVFLPISQYSSPMQCSNPEHGSMMNVPQRVNVAPDWKPYQDVAGSRKMLTGGKAEYREIVVKRKDQGITPAG
jgi:hypothetical protein